MIFANLNMRKVISQKIPKMRSKVVFQVSDHNNIINMVFSGFYLVLLSETVLLIHYGTWVGQIKNMHLYDLNTKLNFF